MNFYNENEPRAATWLRELISAKLIPDGVVDERSIADIKPDELTEFTQCHFFAGIGGWSRALELAGWPVDRPVWTGSCPCQPFSAAGKGLGTADARHLWPVFAELIRACKPPVVFGEQVASKAGREWLAGVFADLEGMAYQRAGADLCAASVGAPHIRQRLWWVADSTSARRFGSVGHAKGNPWDEARLLVSGADGQVDRPADSTTARLQGRTSDTSDIGEAPESSQCVEQPERHGEVGGLGESFQSRLEGLTGNGDHRSEPGRVRAGTIGSVAQAGSTGGVANPEQSNVVLGSETQREAELARRASPCKFYDDAIIIPCRDGKARRIPRIAEPVFQRMADGLFDGVDHNRPEDAFPLCGKVEGRVALLKGYGNAINPYVAAEFIACYLEITQ